MFWFKKHRRHLADEHESSSSFFFSSLTFSIQKVRHSRCVILRKDRRFDPRLLIYAIRFNFQPFTFLHIDFSVYGGMICSRLKIYFSQAHFLFQRRVFLSATIDLSIYFIDFIDFAFLSIYYTSYKLVLFQITFRILVNKFLSNVIMIGKKNCAWYTRYKK